MITSWTKKIWRFISILKMATTYLQNIPKVSYGEIVFTWTLHSKDYAHLNSQPTASAYQRKCVFKNCQPTENRVRMNSPRPQQGSGFQLWLVSSDNSHAIRCGELKPWCRKILLACVYGGSNSNSKSLSLWSSVLKDFPKCGNYSKHTTAYSYHWKRRRKKKMERLG